MKKSDSFAEDIVADIMDDLSERVEARRAFDSQWDLNARFVAGDQFCVVGPGGAIVEESDDYAWRERQVYNHTAAIVETRLAKLSKVRPKMSVRPSSADDDDLRAAAASGKVLNSVWHKLDMSSIIAEAANWSELTGTVFYKISWDAGGGKAAGVLDGKTVNEGEVRVDVCPPSEIFPSSLSCRDVEDCVSIIHCRALPAAEIYRKWGKRVRQTAGERDAAGGDEGGREERVLVVERYARPTADRPDGRLEIAAAGELLYSGPLPYFNSSDGMRGYPFVRQESLKKVGSFFGMSMVERVIPIQRAYNAVKNRKHEFLNRLSVGVLAVEDGSVDTENLEAEGLGPGKVLSYRQGCPPPRLLSAGSVPADFSYEEDRLLNEFVTVSGVSEVLRSSSIPSSISSGTALQLLLDQDDTRLSVTAERVRAAVRGVAQHIIRLYRQFAAAPRLFRCVGEDGDIELMSWRGSNLDSDDVVFDTENELASSEAQKRSMLFDLLKLGLFSDEEGRLSETMRSKILDVVGYGGWEFTRDTQKLQTARAVKENYSASAAEPEVLDIDDHALHVAEHTKFILTPDFERRAKDNPGLRQRLLAHIAAHKAAGGGDA